MQENYERPSLYRHMWIYTCIHAKKDVPWTLSRRFYYTISSFSLYNTIHQNRFFSVYVIRPNFSKRTLNVTRVDLANTWTLQEDACEGSKRKKLHGDNLSMWKHNFFNRQWILKSTSEFLNKFALSSRWKNVTPEKTISKLDFEISWTSKCRIRFSHSRHCHQHANSLNADESLK